MKIVTGLLNEDKRCTDFDEDRFPFCGAYILTLHEVYLTRKM